MRSASWRSTTFPAIIRQMRKRLGDPVQRGDVLATVHSNEASPSIRSPPRWAGRSSPRIGDRQSVEHESVPTRSPISLGVGGFPIYPRAQDRSSADERSLQSESGPRVVAEGVIRYVGPLLEQDTRVSYGAWCWTTGSAMAAGDDARLSHRRAHRGAVAVPETHRRLSEGRLFRATATPSSPPVTVGRSDRKTTEITEGLEAGARIVIRNAFLLKADWASPRRIMSTEHPSRSLGPLERVLRSGFASVARRHRHGPMAALGVFHFARCPSMPCPTSPMSRFKSTRWSRVWLRWTSSSASRFRSRPRWRGSPVSRAPVAVPLRSLSGDRDLRGWHRHFLRAPTRERATAGSPRQLPANLAEPAMGPIATASARSSCDRGSPPGARSRMARRTRDGPAEIQDWVVKPQLRTGRVTGSTLSVATRSSTRDARPRASHRIRTHVSRRVVRSSKTTAAPEAASSPTRANNTSSIRPAGSGPRARSARSSSPHVAAFRFACETWRWLG